MALLSRVADRIFWAARFMERAEDTARVVAAFGDVYMGMPTIEHAGGSLWAPLAAFGGGTPSELPTDEAGVVRLLVVDRARAGSVAASIDQARDNLRTTREVLPREAWRAVNNLWIFVDREVAALNATASGPDALEIGPYLAMTPSVTPLMSGGLLDGMFDLDFTPGRTLVDVARAVSARIHNTFVFDPMATDVTTPLDDLIVVSRGVCQDFAHLAIAVFRRRGLAARYVSGYIETDPPPGEPKSIGADASHAWCAFWLPGYGWVDLDPTNDQLPITRHITVAWGRDYRDVAPVRGVVIGPVAGQTLDVAVDVRRVG